jgi:SAM-dependent methyltransferase
MLARVHRHSVDRAHIAKQFWEKEILAWEEGRYQLTGATRRSLLQRVGDRASWSLRFRQQISVRLIQPHIVGKRILELGCGSGLLAPRFLAAGASLYRGVDISPTAIAAANERKAKHGWGDAVRFSVGAAADMPRVDEDLVFSLGLLDWLTDAEIDVLFRQQAGADFLHSIAEPRRWVQQWLHQAYVYASYGHRTREYVPRLLSASDVAAQLRTHFRDPIHVYRDARLSFGALISSFPIGPTIASSDLANGADSGQRPPGRRYTAKAEAAS